MDEQELQQRLHRAVEGATPDSARLWENVMEASDHARKVRNAKRTGIILTVLAFAIATPIALNMVNSPDDGGLVEPGGSASPSVSPSATATPTLAASYTTYVDTELNVTFPIPRGWEVAEFEGHRTAHPGPLPAPPQDGDTAYVSVTYGDLGPAEGRVSTTFAGLPAEEVTTETQHWIIVSEWPESPFCKGKSCTRELSLWSDASTPDLLAGNSDGFDLIFDGFAPLYDADGALAAIDAPDLKTRRGTVSHTDSSVPINDATATVMGFMDTRAWIEDYGTYVTDQAMQQYRNLEMPDGSSRRDFPEQWFLETYDIVSADAADANSFEIVVSIDFVKYGDTAADEEHALISERLFVGPGTAADGTTRTNVVRAVIDEA